MKAKVKKRKRVELVIDNSNPKRLRGINLVISNCSKTLNVMIRKKNKQNHKKYIKPIREIGFEPTTFRS